jgi:hypothetical protein
VVSEEKKDHQHDKNNNHGDDAMKKNENQSKKHAPSSSERIRVWRPVENQIRENHSKNSSNTTSKPIGDAVESTPLLESTGAQGTTPGESLRTSCMKEDKSMVSNKSEGVKFEKEQEKPAITRNSTNNNKKTKFPGKGWASLKGHVDEGTLLLSPSTSSASLDPTEPLRRRSIVMRERFAEIREGMNFSVYQCFLAILLYLAVSVVVFTFVLEPGWTIIDTCYFAVATFTTIGKYFFSLFRMENVLSISIASFFIMGHSCVSSSNLLVYICTFRIRRSGTLHPYFPNIYMYLCIDGCGLFGCRFGYNGKQSY